MNTLCASPLNLCCNFNIISLFLHFLKSSNLVACLIRYFFLFLFVKIAIICLITIHLLYQRNKLFQCSSITDFIVGCIKYCLNIFCKFVLNILRFDMYYDAFCVCVTVLHCLHILVLHNHTNTQTSIYCICQEVKDLHTPPCSLLFFLLISVASKFSENHFILW